MAVSKIVYDGRALIDLTADTVTADALLSGTTAHDKAGNAITGAADVCDRLHRLRAHRTQASVRTETSIWIWGDTK